MRFVSTAIVSADVVGYFIGRKDPCRFDNGTLAVQPIDIDRIEPGALAW